MKRKKDTRFKMHEQILDNALSILSKDGTIKKEIPFSDLISENTKLLDAAKDNKNILQPYLYGKDALNIFHTNTVEVIDREIVRDGDKIFSRGNVLFCMRNVNTIGVLDVEKEKIIWSWGIEELDCPHSPTLLGNGNILIFDNGTFRGYSRVIEIDPYTGQIMWEYKGDPPDSFYSYIMGSVQRLPNGNTLICNSVSGQVCELTREGDIAWEVWNTDIDPKTGGKRASIYRFIRISEQEYSLPSKGQTIRDMGRRDMGRR